MLDISKPAKGSKNYKMPKVKVSKEVGSYANDPFFIKKTEAAEAFIDKHGVPKELLTKK